MANANARDKLWIVERDMPGSRNLIPILNRATFVGIEGEGTYKCSIEQPLTSEIAPKSPFWPAFGSKARMNDPVRVPDGFPAPEPRLLPEPKENDGSLKWSDITVLGGTSVAAYSDTYLGPPDLFHSKSGHRFGSIAVLTEYDVKKHRNGVAKLTCRIHIVNHSKEDVEKLEFGLFFPRALLDNLTGQEIPLLKAPRIRAEGLSDEPLDLLICDGIARPAWGYRCVNRFAEFAAKAKHTINITVEAEPDGDCLVIPVVTLRAKVPARFWPSSQVALDNSIPVQYDDYTHFNVVLGDSRCFRFEGKEATVERASQLLRDQLSPSGVHSQ